MTEKKYLLREPDVLRLVGWLKKFFGSDEKKTKNAIIKVLEDNPYASNAEIFRRISNNRGAGKPHGSKIREGSLPALTPPRKSRRSSFR